MEKANGGGHLLASEELLILISYLSWFHSLGETVWRLSLPTSD
jgi:hypothetical protein